MYTSEEKAKLAKFMAMLSGSKGEKELRAKA